MDAGADLPPLLFDDEQAVALAVALQLAATSSAGIAGIADAAWRALGTVRQVMPARLRRRVDSLQVLGLPSTAALEVDPAVLGAVSAAVHAREVLRLDYAAATSPAPAATGGGRDAGLVPPRRVEPHHVLARGGRWYLLAWDLEREDWRTFPLDRVNPRLPTGPRFTPREGPGADAAALVAARFRGADRPAPSGGTAGGWPCRGEVILHAPAADVVPYVGDGAVEALGPNRCRLSLGAWSWAGLAASIVRFDADVEVVGPPELTEAFTALARRCTRAAAARTSRPADSADPAAGRP